MRLISKNYKHFCLSTREWEQWGQMLEQADVSWIGPGWVMMVTNQRVIR